MPDNTTQNTNEDANLRNILINYLKNNAPDELLKQFCNIVIHTNDFLKIIMDNKLDEQARANYVSRSLDCVNVINKFVAMVGSGASPSAVGAFTDQSAEQDAKTKQSIRESNKVEPPTVEDLYDMDEEEIDNLTAEDIISEELDNWGINPNTYGYKAIVSLASIKPWTNKKYRADDLIVKIAEKNGKPLSTTHSALQSLVSKADFSKSKYIELFKSMNKKQITKEMVIEQFYDFVK